MMRHRLTRFLMTVCLVAMIITPAMMLRAQDETRGDKGVSVSIGGSGSVMWHDPVWGRVSQREDMMGTYLVFRWNKIEKMSREYPVQPGGFGGLHIAVTFPRGWGLTFDARAGTYRNASYVNLSLLNGMLDYVKFTVAVLCFEGDLRAEYRVTSWFRVFAGPRYEGLLYRERYSSWFGAVHESRRTMFNTLGMTAGGAFTVRLVGDLSLVPSVAFVTMYGLTTGTIFGDELRHSFALGGDVVVPLSYSFKKINTTVSLGLKYQFLNYLESGRSVYRNSWDHRYGLVAAGSYTF